MSETLTTMESMVRRAQEDLCRAVGSFDESSFREDPWRHGEGGGGVSRVLQEGTAFSKAGVNVASVRGTLSEDAVEAMVGRRAMERGARRFAATGLSVVIHPRNPYVPTVHCNFRYFELEDGTWWFGGGADLTPIYLFDDDARHFHLTLKGACDRHDPEYYPRFKRWCDEYFYLPHRGETRGVGGIFFDDLDGPTPEAAYAFVADCAASFAPAYVPIVDRRIDTPYGPEQERWQALRRARYVEFNLMYDRGTRFGLRTGGRVESILMSMPLEARWEYGFAPEPGSPEAALVSALREPSDWV